ncbi:MAG: BatA domain-containing protein [Bacteroidales bacterium]|nr:BatA domain-containing protein [Bacteroidales bacterium]
MIFLQPNYLWGLLAIAIPIIIHLFRFRRYKTVYFSSIAVLKAVKSETKKQSRLKHILVLISRILAITMLVMAFARPVIPEKQGEGVTRGNRYVSVYIDNSLSMQIPGRDGMLLSQAREQALAIASSYSATDRFRLLTNDFNASRTRFTDRESFVNQVEGVTITSVTRRFEEVRQRILAHDAPAETHKSYLISDFQKSTFNFDGLTPDSSASVTMVPLAGVKPANLYIDSCWFEKPSVQLMQTSNLKVLIRNSGQQDYEKIPLKLRIDGKQRALSSFSVAAGGKTEATLSFMNQQTGHREGLLEIEDSPITFDDTFYFSYHIHESTKVLEIYEEEPNLYLQRLFGRDSLIAFEAKNRLRLDYSRLGSYDLIVINGLEKVSTGLERMLQEIREKVDIVFIPSANAPETNSSILQAFNAGTIASPDTGNYEVTVLSEKHPLLDNVFYKRPKSRQNEKYDLPSVKKYFRMSPSLETNVIMRLGNGHPFLTEKRERGHYLYTLASPLNSDFTNFPQHPVFRACFSSHGHSQPKNRTALLPSRSQQHYRGERPANIG